MFNLIVSAEDDNKRLDNVATKNMVRLCPDLEISRTLIQDMVEKGEILLNGNRAKSGHKVKAGDKIDLDLEKLKEKSLRETDRKIPKPEKLPLDIIYEDNDILVVNKPAGMVVHPACGNYSGTLVNALLNYPGFLTKYNEPRLSANAGLEEAKTMRPGIVHRLDKDTSGVMLVAKNGPSHRKLSRQLKNRTITKKYIAIVKGIIELDEGVIDAPISHDRKDRRKMAIDDENGKEAVTYYRVLKRSTLSGAVHTRMSTLSGAVHKTSGAVHNTRDSMRKHANLFTVLEVRPKTGRTHQIRVHLLHIRHPVLGDTLYNGPVVEGLNRQALHAQSISFIHPTKGIPVEYSAPLPQDLERFV